MDSACSTGKLIIRTVGWGRRARSPEATPVGALPGWLRAPRVATCLMDVCNLQGNMQFPREAGDQAPRNENVSGALPRPGIHFFPNLLISLNVSFAENSELGQQSHVQEPLLTPARAAWDRSQPWGGAGCQGGPWARCGWAWDLKGRVPTCPPAPGPGGLRDWPLVCGSSEFHILCEY